MLSLCVADGYHIDRQTVSIITERSSSSSSSIAPELFQWEMEGGDAGRRTLSREEWVVWTVLLAFADLA